MYIQVRGVCLAAINTCKLIYDILYVGEEGVVG